MIKIREIKQEDVEQVKFICKETAPHKENNDEVTAEIIANTYATYYVREEADVCFGLEADGLLVGYIICSVDAKKFKKSQS
jgi:adenine/guanine phosphoribosyltransferase-like PRPP-binding protein